MSLLSGVYFIVMELRTALRQIIGLSLRRISDRLLYPPPEQTGPAPTRAVKPPNKTAFQDEAPLPEPKPSRPRKPYDPTKHSTLYFSSINILRYLLEPDNRDRKFRISELSGRPEGEGPSKSLQRSTQRACEHLWEKGVLCRTGKPTTYGIVDSLLADRTVKEYEQVLGDNGPPPTSPSGDDPGEQEMGSDESPPEGLFAGERERESDRNPLVS
jgi:hypothetical protein